MHWSLLEEEGGESLRDVPGTARMGEDERVNTLLFSSLSSYPGILARSFRDHLYQGRSQFRSGCKNTISVPLELISRYEAANMVSSCLCYRNEGPSFWDFPQNTPADPESRNGRPSRVFSRLSIISPTQKAAAKRSNSSQKINIMMIFEIL